jgi:pimeloyl-ACP methyl ester carboxylesterase
MTHTPRSMDGPDRRHFLGTAAMALAAVRLGIPGAARAWLDRTTPEGRTGTGASFAAFEDVKQIDAGLLNVGYADVGPAGGPAVILLHGWPYDIHSYAEVAPVLAAKGYRVIVPYLRGYGTTRFLSGDTVRNGQQSIVALDIVNLMDALRIRSAVIGGFDWGSRTAAVMAALWPERCKALVCVSGYLVTSLAANRQPLPPGGRARVVVPVLFRDGARSARLRQARIRVQQTDLEERVAEVGLRQGDLRSDRRLVR